MAPPFGLTGVRRALAIAAAALVTTGFFVVSGFPYDRLAPRIEQAIAAATGARVDIGRLDLGLVWVTPELRAEDVDVAWPGGRRLRFERLRVRPAWSTSWLRGHPALVLALRSSEGEVDGTVVAGGEPAFRGTLRQVELGQIPLDEWAPGASLAGRADAELDLAIAADGPRGSARFTVGDGSLSLPLLPIGVPFESLRGELVLGGESLAKIAALDLVGPLVGFSAQGTIGRAPEATMAPLAIDARLDVREPTVRTLLRGQGIVLDAEGKAAVTIGGTLGSPEPQAAPRSGRGS
jgi:type II secretion system protein N